MTADRDLTPLLRSARSVAAGAGVPVACPFEWRRLSAKANSTPADAYVIADAAWTMPCAGSVPTIKPLADLKVSTGFDDDPTAESTRLSHRLRDALLHVHPAPERLLPAKILAALDEQTVAIPGTAAFERVI